MIKKINIKLNIEFPEYRDMKAAIKECERRWNKDDYSYTSDVTYTHLLCWFPGGYHRIYASEDTHFKPTFDEMHDGYLFNDKKFDLSTQGYKELVKYATEKIQKSIKNY